MGFFSGIYQERNEPLKFASLDFKLRFDLILKKKKKTVKISVSNYVFRYGAKEKKKTCHIKNREANIA